MKLRRGSGKKAGGPSMERWLLTYADMITLLMIFFIMMYVISNVNSQKFQQLANILGSVFGNQGSIMPSAGNSILQEQANVSSGSIASADIAQMNQIRAQLEKYFQMKGLAGRVSVQMEERGLVISLQDTMLFDSGSAVLTPDARNIIAEVGKNLQSLPNFILVEGNTDNLPIHNAEFPSNWELSSARATNVVQDLILCGVTPERLSATGYGEYRPQVLNDSDEHRQMNRRVDIVILRTIYSNVEP
jgi:chemotaxis protein MotB